MELHSFISFGGVDHWILGKGLKKVSYVPSSLI